ncbi:GerMN domain-containing protein [Waterburya agarophytonicola K14]|uniref:GerMN domain-containing protein n=1 Tax=Waterburya agarophytonicola KI4 TaxID=2874699 RepID=A0A964BT43_9CYAN|nr:GerMN domain-containing protein [Waterburya agarophytonicola]MCC0177766.1 GerMN domain-containing protein [Waterburya agarophytonicola KI4]
MKAHERSPNTTPILIGLSLLLIGVAQITALLALSKIIIPTVIESSAVEDLQPAKFSPQIYQLELVDNRIRLVPRTLHTAATSPKLALTEALEKLLAQSTVFDPTSTIPSQSRLLDLHINENGVHVDLSKEFTQGGGSSSMIYRTAQVLYTVTSIDPQTPVFFSIEGQPLNEDYPLGGEGLILEYPITRQQFNQEFLAE